MLVLVWGIGFEMATDVRIPYFFSRMAAIIGIVISDRYSSSPVTNTTCGGRAWAAMSPAPLAANRPATTTTPVSASACATLTPDSCFLMFLIAGTPARAD